MSTITTVESSSKTSWDLGIPLSRPADGSPFSLKSLVPKRKRNAAFADVMESDVPPPLPPKDDDHERRSFSPSVYSSTVPVRGSHESDQVRSVSLMNFSASNLETAAPPFPPLHLRASQSQIVISPFKRPQLPPRVISPAENARHRLEAEREREFEFRVALQEEGERQMRLKAEKEEILRRSKEEEVRRKAKMEQDLKMAAVKRAERERAEREADATRAQGLEEKKKIDRERRLLESQKWQAWRDEQVRRKESIILKRNDERRHTQEEKRVRRRELYDKLKTESTEGVLLAGWLSMQTSQTIAWKRRYFTLNKTALHLYKTTVDLSQPIDVLQIMNIRAVRDGGDVPEEEPEFIPNSFTVEDADGCCWSIFTDTQEAKDKLVAALVHAAGVDDSRSKSPSTCSGFFSRIPRPAGN